MIHINVLVACEESQEVCKAIIDALCDMGVLTIASLEEVANDPFYVKEGEQ